MPRLWSWLLWCVDTALFTIAWCRCCSSIQLKMCTSTGTTVSTTAATAVLVLETVNWTTGNRSWQQHPPVHALDVGVVDLGAVLQHIAWSEKQQQGGCKGTLLIMCISVHSMRVTLMPAAAQGKPCTVEQESACT